MKRVMWCAIVLALSARSTFAELKLPRVSQKASVTQTVGYTDVAITYSRPAVKGRVIWGGLVPYDKVWRTGANEATTFMVSKDVTINGKPLPAGTYSLHTIPGKTSWTVIFNKKADQWGSYSYDAADDVLRIETKPTDGPNEEWLTFTFPEVATGTAQVVLAWERVRVGFTIGTDTVPEALADIRKELSGEVKEWNVPYNAASFAFNANLDDKAAAMTWVNQSIALKETFANLRLKAQMLAAAGKKNEAIAAAEKAVTVGKADKNPSTEIPALEKQISDWKAGGA